VTFVITQNCCNDASCVPVCPVDCIRPVPTGVDPRRTMLYIDPAACVDCGACLAECPVGAIYYEDDLPADQRVFLNINADYFAEHPLRVRQLSTGSETPRSVEQDSLRVAIVGSGPAACYAAGELARVAGVRVSVFDRLPTPFGLIRAGVAPDHQRTKDVTSVYEPALGAPGISCYFNVTVGRDLTHDELLAHHHAVIYAVGASTSRDLLIPGSDLDNSRAASDFVAWYNGHPDHANDAFDLQAPRVVIVGNGNVALDVARVLLADQKSLSVTDIASHALDALAVSRVEEVVVLGRRHAGDAAFSIGEFLALSRLPGVDLVVEGPLGERPAGDYEAALKYDALIEASRHEQRPGNKRLVFRFGAMPVELVGADRVEGVRIRPTDAGEQDDDEVLETSLVLRSIGYHGMPIVGLPFDAANGVLPNDAGRVLDAGRPMPGVYAAGWIKRGPRGVIGTNRACAQQTVGAMLDDFRRGVLAEPPERLGALDELLRERRIDFVDWSGWQRIDDAELRAGAQQSRARSKLVTVDQLLAASRG
jgi:ferredoxin/flavodoxin---NADP+ reductase